MFLSTSNILTTSNTAVTTGGNTDYDVADMLTQDFTEQYVSASSSTDFAIAITGTVKFVGLAGVNYYGKCSSIVISSDSSNPVTYTPNASASIMHVFATDVVNPVITFVRGGFTAPITVPYIAAGSAWEVVNGGEQSGYNNVWANPSIKQRTSDFAGVPTVTIQEGMAHKASLTIAALPTVDAKNVWYDFLRFAVVEGFFACEDASAGDYAYYSYNAMPAQTKAHGQTRELKSAGIKYDCLTGR